MRRRATFLSLPYSHPDPITRHQRYLAAAGACAWMIRRGHLPVCPITMFHTSATFWLRGDQYGSRFWQDLTLEYAARCDSFGILQLDGWEESEGVKAEIAHFRERGINPFFIHESEIKSP